MSEDKNDSVKINNNPIKLLFELVGTASDAVNEYARRGLVVTDEKKMNMRMALCSECKSFEKNSARCGLCGCFMNVKVRIEASKCPLSKW